MRRTLLSLLLSLFLLAPLQANKVSDSLLAVAHYTSNEYLCTAFAVQPKRWLTAAHCVEGMTTPGYIRNEIPTVLKVDRGVDLALLEGPLSPVLTISKVAPEIGEEVMALGWPGSWPGREALPFWGKVQTRPLSGIQIDSAWPTHDLVFMNVSVAPGMSGGPILNSNGEVVGMVEAVAAKDEIGVQVGSQTLKAIRKFLGLK